MVEVSGNIEPGPCRLQILDSRGDEWVQGVCGNSWVSLLTQDCKAEVGEASQSILLDLPSPLLHLCIQVAWKTPLIKRLEKKCSRSRRS